ncbi:MAG: hypothetical protein V1793_13775 [Pseudomonadota bacterium]
MKIISFSEKLDVMEKILRHLDLWDIRNHDPPQKVSDCILELVYDKAGSQIPEHVRLGSGSVNLSFQDALTTGLNWG